MVSMLLATVLSVAPAAPLPCAPPGNPGYGNPYCCPQVDLLLPCPPSINFRIYPAIPPAPCFGGIYPPPPNCPPPSICPPVVNTHPCPPGHYGYGFDPRYRAK